MKKPVTVTLEIVCDLMVDDSIDWKARADKEWAGATEEMFSSLAQGICLNNRGCSNLDGFADLPDEAVDDRGWVVGDITVEETL